MGKFDKKEACEYCGEKMEAKQRNKRFCSDKCRVYWNRENKMVKESVLEKVIQPVIDTTIAYSKIQQLAEKRIVDDNPMPIRMEGEDAFDYAARKNEWKKNKKQ